MSKIELELKIFRKELPEPKPEWPNKIHRVLHCIHEHLFDPTLTVQQLKEKCTANGTNFSGTFKYYVGLSPKEYIVKYRIAAACRLLKRVPAEYPILHVAIVVGFSSHSAFSRTFKRRKGVTPSEFRHES
ncbi:AraC family transcriptional regulator [Aliifodinibius salicampi]|uniref:AraC family transcriptional regulator n=1 Tax=Fodinibius salicampi TaxID=1920655 RepID=A0ABT3PWM1_9BACT|nr:AraC family transcriptional regulator [Fodinibius salicampi]MCW9712247.1 AraC family transcriptional regulator [Fodinibius salicampi]